MTVIFFAAPNLNTDSAKTATSILILQAWIWKLTMISLHLPKPLYYIYLWDGHENQGRHDRPFAATQHDRRMHVHTEYDDDTRH